MTSVTDEVVARYLHVLLWQDPLCLRFPCPLPLPSLPPSLPPSLLPSCDTRFTPPDPAVSPSDTHVCDAPVLGITKIGRARAERLVQ